MKNKNKFFDTPIRAMRKKCLDCCCGSRKEIRECRIIECPIYPYRFGRRPTQAIVDTINEYYNEKTEAAQ